MVYIDPPYYSKLSDNGYVRRYHFLEGIVKSWKDVNIQENSIVKKFKNYPSMFDTLKGSETAIELLINGAEEVCKQQGYKYIFSIGRNKHLINTHKKLGYHVDNKPSYEIIKKIN